MRWPRNMALEAAKDSEEQMGTAGSGMERKYWLVLVLYGALALLVWFTMDGGTVFVEGKAVQLRVVPLVIIGGLALRTVLARQADRIRHGGQKGGDEPSGSL